MITTRSGEIALRSVTDLNLSKMAFQFYLYSSQKIGDAMPPLHDHFLR